MKIRKADINDVEKMLEIYNYEVVNGVATLDIKPKVLEEWTVWFNKHNNNHPIIVAEDDEVMGYASLSEYREKEAYSSTVELSVYVGHEYRNRGVATELMKNIIEIAKNDDTIHMIVSVITSGNEASKKLHKKFGFNFCGTIHEVGYKKEKFQDIDNYELILTERI